LRGKVLESNMPSEGERKRIQIVSSKLMADAEDVIHGLGLEEVRPMLAGSVAKGTMTRDPDIDLFLLFPPDTKTKFLEKKGLKIGRKLLDGPERKYTQHPYLTGSYMGMRCDVVPCLHLPRGEKVITAVDRTPHHTEYINTRVSKGLIDEILLLKSFFKGIGVYGAEDTVQGFSGYLTEILVLYFGGFSETIRYIAGLGAFGAAPGGCEEIVASGSKQNPLDLILFDRPGLMEEEPGEPEGYMGAFRRDALIVIDPVDPSRNVASPISMETLDYTARASRALISAPSLSYFSPFSSRPYSPGTEKGQSKFIGNLFTMALPKGDPSVTSTQLRRYLRRLKLELVRRGFEEVHLRYLIRFPQGQHIEPGYLRARTTWCKQDGGPDVLITIETEPRRLEEEYIHWGPPLHNPRVKDFNLKWGDRAMTDDSRCRAYTLIKREEVKPEGIALSVWNQIQRGGSFKVSELEHRSPEEIPSRELKALMGEFLPWAE
jgi:tRNA nucleotidyltransferase (CCA-adding enzyme)